MADEPTLLVDRELDAITRAARSALPSSVAVCAAAIGAANGDPLAALPPEEARHVARAVAKRQREFAVGRACARAALAQVGVAASIPAGAQREPLWPEGVAGSITHHGGYCVAAAERVETVRALGIDLADAEPLDPDLVARICTATDRRALLAIAPNPWPFDPHKAIFCIKEAVYKCVFPLVGVVLAFHDVDVVLDLPACGANVRLANRPFDAEIHCRFAATARHLFAGAWIAARHEHAELPRSREHVSR